MKLVLQRKYKKPNYIIGKLYIDGTYFCDTLEDKDRGLYQDMTVAEIKRIKVPKETAIPYGAYKVNLSYSPRFKKILPIIQNVPGFVGIRIHSGNTIKDTEGCILLGKNNIKGKVTNSKYWVEQLLTKLKKQTDITMEIV